MIQPETGRPCRGAAALLALAAVVLAAGPASAGHENDPDAFVVNYFTGGGTDGVLFAAGTANQQCTDQGLPQITVLSASPGVRISVTPGTYTVTGTDYGYLVCLGRKLPGMIVRGSGSGQAEIRVTYPPIGQWYTHTLTLPAR
ncbi:hypothetical protein [Azorhizobium sp. AG788]|uniref:hypothetical protein n=1 Tax=Azorhizobium sp. AG788 TaxID=2183897 RepID=UPI003139D323